MVGIKSIHNADRVLWDIHRASGECYTEAGSSEQARAASSQSCIFLID
jgi:hypothetical protein